jgi:hypothetical protein
MYLRKWHLPVLAVWAALLLSSTIATAQQGQPHDPGLCDRGDQTCLLQSWIEYKTAILEEFYHWGPGYEAVALGDLALSQWIVTEAINRNYYRHSHWNFNFFCCNKNNNGGPRRIECSTFMQAGGKFDQVCSPNVPCRTSFQR